MERQKIVPQEQKVQWEQFHFGCGVEEYERLLPLPLPSDDSDLQHDETKYIKQLAIELSQDKRKDLKELKYHTHDCLTQKIQQPITSPQIELNQLHPYNLQVILFPVSGEEISMHVEQPIQNQLNSSRIIRHVQWSQISQEDQSRSQTRRMKHTSRSCVKKVLEDGFKLLKERAKLGNSELLETIENALRGVKGLKNRKIAQGRQKNERTPRHALAVLRAFLKLFKKDQEIRKIIESIIRQLRQFFQGNAIQTVIDNEDLNQLEIQLKQAENKKAKQEIKNKKKQMKETFLSLIVQKKLVEKDSSVYRYLDRIPKSGLKSIENSINQLEELRSVLEQQIPL